VSTKLVGVQTRIPLVIAFLVLSVIVTGCAYWSVERCVFDDCRRHEYIPAPLYTALLRMNASALRIFLRYEAEAPLLLHIETTQGQENKEKSAPF